MFQISATNFVSPPNLGKSLDSDNSEISFDAIDVVDWDDSWFDAHNESLFSPILMKEKANECVPFTEDCQRCAKQMIMYLGGIKQNELISLGLSKLFPTISGDIFFIANSLYVAVVQKKHLDVAIFNGAGLATSLLLSNGNMISQLAHFIQETIHDYVGEFQLEQFIPASESYGHIYTALSVLAITISYQITNNPEPQRAFLRAPAFIVNLLIRANCYLNILGHIAQNAMSTPLQRSTFEVDSNIEFTSDTTVPISTENFLRTKEKSGMLKIVGSRGKLTDFSSNSTVRSELFVTESIQAEPIRTLASTTDINTKLHFSAIGKFEQLSGIESLHCNSIRTETTQLKNRRMVTNTYINTKCDAIHHPSKPLGKNSKTKADAMVSLAQLGLSDAKATRAGNIVNSRHKKIMSPQEKSRGMYECSVLSYLQYAYDCVAGFFKIDFLKFPGSEAASLISKARNVAYINAGINEKNDFIKLLGSKEISLRTQGRSFAPYSVNIDDIRRVYDKGRMSIQEFYAGYISKHPSLKILAHRVLKNKILQNFHLALDPDKTYFMHFQLGSIENGEWVHNCLPINSGTLTSYLFTNFPAAIQDNLVDMNALCGIYNATPPHTTRFNTSNQVLGISPTSFIDLVWNIDFYNYAREAYEKSFDDKDAHVKRYFIDLIIDLSVGQIDNSAAKDVLAGVGILKNGNISVSLLGIGKYAAINSFIFRNGVNDRVTIYFPKSHFKFISFEDANKARSWILSKCSKEDEECAMILSHFAISHRHGYFGYGVKDVLRSFDRNLDPSMIISLKEKIISSNLFFEEMVSLAREGTFSDLKSLIVSNAEVVRDMWEESIDASNVIPNPVSPFLSVAIHVEHLFDAKTYDEQEKEVSKIEGDFVNIALMSAMGKAVTFQAEGYEFINGVRDSFNEENSINANSKLIDGDIELGDIIPLPEKIGSFGDASAPSDERYGLEASKKKKTLNSRLEISPDHPKLLQQHRNNLVRNLYFSEAVISRLKGIQGVDETLVGNVRSDKNGLYKYSDRTSKKIRKALKIGGKFYRVLYQKSKGYTILAGTSRLKLTKFGNTYYLFKKGIHTKIKYSSCSPFPPCLRLSVGVNKLLKNKQLRGIPKTGMGSRLPRRNALGIYENSVGQLFLPYEDSFFYLKYAKKRGSDNVYLIKPGENYEGRAIAEVCIHSKVGRIDVTTPVEYLMERIGISPGAAHIHEARTHIIEKISRKKNKGDTAARIKDQGSFASRKLPSSDSSFVKITAPTKFFNGNVGYRAIANCPYVQFLTISNDGEFPGSETLVVSSHGGYVDSDLSSPAIALPADVTIKMLTPHGTLLSDPTLDNVVNSIFQPYVTFTMGRNVHVNYIPQRHSEWNIAANFAPDDPAYVYGRADGLQNYRHYQFEGESDEMIADALVKNRRLAMKGQAVLTDILVMNDEITDKGMTSLEEASVQKVIDLDQMGQLVNSKGERYKHIIFSHCRNNFLKMDASTYKLEFPAEDATSKKGGQKASFTVTLLTRNDVNKDFFIQKEFAGHILFMPISYGNHSNVSP